MEFQQMDFQFLDLNDIPEKEVNELCEILNPTDPNSYVELPWRYETAVNTFSSTADENGDIQVECEEESPLVCYTSYDGSGASHDVTEINSAVVPPPFMPVVTSISYLPADQPFSFIPHTYPVIPQYLGLPLFTQNVHQQDLNIVQACHYPYPPPISNVNSFTSVTDKTESQDSNQNGQSSADKQYLRRNKKKRPFNYYASSEMCVNTDAYQPGSVVLDSQMATMIPLNDQSVLSHNPVVPFNVPPPNYPMTNGTMPMAGIGSNYPHEITMHYSSMANPHTGSAPMFCVPVIPSPYHHGYMPHPTPSTAVHQVVGNGQTCDQYLPDVCVTTSDVQNGYNYCETVMNHQPNSDNKRVDLNYVNTCVNQQSIDTSSVSELEGTACKETGAVSESETCGDEHGDTQLSELSNTSGVSVSPTLVTVESEVEKKPEWVLGDATSSDISLTDLSENNNRCLSSCSSELSALSVKLTEKSVGVADKDSCETENHDEKTSSDIDGYVSLTSSVLSGDIQTCDKVDMGIPDNGIQPHRSWADLFKMMSLGNSTSEKDVINETEAAACTTNARKVSEVSIKNLVSTDLSACKTAKILMSVRLNHAAQFLIPRGLVNRSNWCYVNAILQALLVCPPLYNLLKRLPREGINRSNSSTPVIDSLTCFMNEFSPMPYGSKRKRKEDLSFGVPFEPHYVYSLLTTLKPDCFQDCQQDAEEVIGFLLNGLHEEMVAVLDNYKGSVGNKYNGHEDNLSNGHITGGVEEHDSDNKKVTVHSMCFSDSPISDIFGGQLTTVLTVANETSTNLQPFFTLPLDIQADEVQWVSDALAHMTAKEPIQDYTCTETKQEVEAFRQSSFSMLPLVLILHLKRFVYNRGGPKKTLKDVNFSIDLEISEETLSPGVRRKYSARPLRSYKLFAVVYHEGKDLSKGHYITDAYHVGSGSWLRYDDSTITVITDSQLLSPSPPRVPYLLFYRRLDTLHPWNPTK